MKDETMKNRNIRLAVLIACVLVTPLTAQDKKPAADPAKRQVYFGEQHLHTTISLDAYIMGNHKNTPTDAFNYNKGKPVKKYSGRTTSLTSLPEKLLMNPLLAITCLLTVARVSCITARAPSAVFCPLTHAVVIWRANAVYGGGDSTVMKSP